jgi:CBS domain-containing protein
MGEAPPPFRGCQFGAHGFTTDGSGEPPRPRRRSASASAIDAPDHAPGRGQSSDSRDRVRSLIVLGPRGRLVGIATDRDLALALGRVRDVGRLTLDRVMSQPVHICGPDDDLSAALERMPSSRVRRLPVANADGDVKGLISIDDIVLGGLKPSGVKMDDLVTTLRSLCAASGFAAREYATGDDGVLTDILTSIATPR